MSKRLTALALLAGTFLAAPALASFGDPCPPAGCLYDPQDSPYGNGSFDFDYTVPPDGHAYRWAVDFTSADPLATVTLGTPNQTEVFTTIRNGAGFDYGYDGNPPYTFIPTITPHRSTWLVRAPAQFDRCALPGPDGQVCAAVVHIWGNGTLLTINSSAPVLARFSETAVPEPRVWVMFVAGFGVVGVGMRRLRGGRLGRPAA